MSPHALVALFTNVEPFFCLAAFFILMKKGLVKQYAYLAALLIVKVLKSATYILSSKLVHHGLTVKQAYHFYFYSYWTTFAAESILWLLIIYSVYKLAMEPLKGLQTLGMLIFRWAAAISAAVTIAMAFGPHASTTSMIVSAVTQLQQTASILTLCLLLFVTFAIRPMGLSYRSHIFGITLGMGLLSTTNLVGAAWFSWLEASANGHYHMGRSNLDIATITSSLVVMALWSAYFALPEPRRGIIMLPTTSPFLRWNQISLALGGSPGYVAVGSVAPDAFAGAELEMMRRSSTVMKMTEIKDISIAV